MLGVIKRRKCSRDGYMICLDTRYRKSVLDSEYIERLSEPYLRTISGRRQAWKRIEYDVCILSHY